MAQGRNHWAAYAFCYLCGVVVAGCVGAIAYLVGRVVNQAYESHSFATLIGVCVAIVAVTAVKSAASYAQAVAFSRVHNAISADLQKQMFDHVLTRNLATFDGRSAIAALNEMSVGASTGSLVLGNLVTGLGRDLLSLVVLMGVVVWQNPWLSLLSVTTLPFIALSVRRSLRQLPAAVERQYLARQRVLEVMHEALRGLGTIKAFTAEARTRDRMHREIDAVQRSADHLARLSSASRPLMEVLGSISTCIIFLYGGYRVIVLGDLPGAYLSFAASSVLAFAPAKRLAMLRAGKAEMFQGLRVLFKFLDEPAHEVDEPGLPALQVFGGRITFTDVQFAYRADEPVLRRLNFVAEPGAVTALVGPSGSGKSTILNLLLRLYEPQFGVIAIDGQPLASVTRNSLRSQIALVSQDVVLFSDTIAENIRFGVDAGDDDVVAAAKAAAAHEFIGQLPEGYATRIGDAGVALSTGERQRVSIARALLKNAPIILLDEATASLDAAADLDVRRAIARLCRGRTTIVVAHRLNTIVEADAIYVLDQGVIVEEGRHSQMIQRGGRYAALYRSMFEEVGSEARGSFVDSGS